MAYRTTPSATLPQQRCPAELFFGRKSRTTLDLLLPTKQPTGRDTKMERQFNRRHGAVERNFDVGDPVYARYRQSQDWMAGSVAKRIGGRLYDVTLANGSTHRFHAIQMRSRSTKLMDDDFTAFADTFNLPIRRPQATNREVRHLDNHAEDHDESPSTRRLQRWTTPTQSRQATHCRHSDVLNEFTFQRNNLNWTLVGNHTGTIKVTPRVQVPSFPLGLAAKKGRCWDPCLTSSWPWNIFRPCSVMFGTPHQEATFSRVHVA